MANPRRYTALLQKRLLLCAAVTLTVGCRVEDVQRSARSVEEYPGMAYVPPGEFIIGAEETGALRHVTLSGFHIDTCETTNEQYMAFVSATGHTPPNSDSGEPWFNSEVAEHPVVNVTFADAVAYARWARKRLATEEEWERAARGVDGRIYPWGAEFDRTKCNVSGKGTAPVGTFPDDLSPAGCYDMAGNVSEWTASWYDGGIQGTLPETGASTLRFRVVRGGAWDYRVASTKVYGRRRAVPDVRSEFVGFRCARDE